MMRVAVVSYWYPPMRTIASLRVAKFVKYLPEFGWDPHVFTVAPLTTRYTAAGELPDEAPPGHVHRVPDPSLHALVDRVSRRRAAAPRAAAPASGVSAGRLKAAAYRVYREVACTPDETWPWLRHYRAIRAMAERAHVDLVFSTSPPATAHLLARRLARDLGRPWVADLRDPWADMHTLDRSAARGWVDRVLERRTLRAAAALTTVSTPMAERFAADYAAPVHVIMNGYDETDVPADVQVEPERDRFALVYTGMLYEGRRTPQLVFEALRHLQTRGQVDLSRVVVKLFGRNLDIAERELRAFPELASSVHLGGEIGYRDALIEQRRATVLLQLEWPDPRARGVLTGKLFEYLFAARPIVAIGPHGGEMERILTATGRGTLSETVEELAEAIRVRYERFCAGGPEQIDTAAAPLTQFSRKAMTAKLADVFRSACEGAPAAQRAGGVQLAGVRP